MGTDAIRVSGVVPAKAERVYEAYLDSDLHGAMTGAPASVVPQVGGRHRAWGDYIQGEFLELGDGRIVQSWRAGDFPPEAGHSRLEILIEPEGEEARVTFIHTELPEGMGEGFVKGWEDYYLKPMRDYFAKAAKKASPAEKAAAAPAKKAAPEKAEPVRRAAPKTAGKGTKAKKATPAKKGTKAKKPTKAKKAKGARKVARKPAKKARKVARKPAKKARRVARKPAKKARRKPARARKAGKRAPARRR